jgi:hypothetical protein
MRVKVFFGGEVPEADDGAAGDAKKEVERGVSKKVECVERFQDKQSGSKIDKVG